MVRIYFRNGQVRHVGEATDAQQVWFHDGNSGRLMIRCVDDDGTEVERFTSDQIICYQVTAAAAA